METEAAMKIENRQKFLLILTIAVLALWLGDMLVFEPLVKWWKTRSATITELRNDVRDGKSILLREAGIRSQWENMRTNTIPANKSLAEQQVLKSFDSWASESGATVTGITPQWKNDSTNYLTLNCRVEASGTIATLGAFLYHIEKGPMALKLDSVEFSAHDNTGQQLTLGLQISGLALASSDAK
jgi:Tfp pilus assembly protein PilO